MVKNGDNKSFKGLQEKLNKKLEESGTKFLSIDKNKDGQIEVLARVNSNPQMDTGKVRDGNFWSKFIKPIKVEKGHSISPEAIEKIQRKIDEAHEKDTQNNPGKSIARLDIRNRDTLSDLYVDAREKRADQESAKKLYERSEREYYRTGIYGTTIDLLSNLCATGFYNEINDSNIKEFYDSWAADTDLISVTEKIFHDLLKYSVCYIMPAHSSYEPHLEGISSIPGKAPSTTTRAGMKASIAYILNEFLDKNAGGKLDFNTFSELYSKQFEKGASGNIPVAYTILDPKYITLEYGGFFNKSLIKFDKKGLKPLKKLLDDLQKIPTKSTEIKSMLKMIPKGLQKAAEDSQDYYFAEGEVSVIFLRKEDFETYSKPRGARAFDSFDYKDELKKADFATIDGIQNFILKVTIGDKDNPATDMQVLEDLAEAFNTPQKAFTIVWNHTLQIEKITATEVGDILGQAKYDPVDKDIGAALGIARALIDGTTLSGDAAELAVKALQSEISAVRRRVVKWIYGEYRKIAMEFAFNTYPKVRWKEPVISTDSDAVTKSSFMQILDRKGMSIRTYMTEMGYDYDTEVQRLTEELPLIQAGILQAGSPNQKSSDTGRPTGQPTSQNKPVDENKVVKRNTTAPSPSQQDHASEEAGTDVKALDFLIEQLTQLDSEVKEKIIKKLIDGSGS